MNARAYRKLIALSQIAAVPRTTQRSLAKRIEVSLGLANALLRELESQRLVSVRPESAPGEARYVLTARGQKELAQLGADLLSESDDLLKPLRQELVQEAKRLRKSGIRKVVLFASGVTADLAAGVLQDARIRVSSVVMGEEMKPKTSSANRVITLSAEDAREARRVFGRKTKIIRLAPRPSARGIARG